MAFAQRFNEVTSDVTHISELEVFRAYPIERADRVTTRFCGKILLAIRDSENRLLKLFLPQRYGVAFKDDNLQAINEGTARWNLVSKDEVQGQMPTNLPWSRVDYSRFRCTWTCACMCFVHRAGLFVSLTDVPATSRPPARRHPTLHHAIM